MSPNAEVPIASSDFVRAVAREIALHYNISAEHALLIVDSTINEVGQAEIDGFTPNQAARLASLLFCGEDIPKRVADKRSETEKP